ncbi:unnamed protein product [Porites lobata]|uniref:Uncharacterized protein n=1 Tax=Porites lobata TaxID=104759 RepID=A0ABN8P8H7_9CNID|nr:unnamed protein product [Porites lobata]
MNLNPLTKQGKALHCEVCEMIVEKWLEGSSDFVTNSICMARQITLVCDVGAERSLIAGWFIELNFSLKLLCFMLSQVLQMLILKYYFYAKDKKCPTATSSGQGEANLAF